MRIIKFLIIFLLGSQQYSVSAELINLGLSNTVKKHGQLTVDEKHLTDQFGKQVQLRGVSSFWLNWIGEFSNPSSIKTLKDEWGINIFRAAMGVEAEFGYLEDPVAMVTKVESLIQTCIKQDLYIIVDYHSHDAHKDLKAAQKFFAYIAKKYGKYPNIIYEIWNEPLKISWDDEIKPYMEEVIKTIRRYDKKNIILVGSPYWCQHVSDAYENPVKDNNVMYTTHFYTGSAGETRRQEIERLWQNGCPIFVSEFGVSIYDGGTLDRKVYLEEADRWIDWMNDRNISWVAWSLCDKNESSALLSPGSPKNGSWKDGDLSKAGRYIKTRLRLK